MAIIAFPPVETADDDGLLAIGGDLEEESLMLAYRSGIFPWPINEGILAWFAPPQRAVIFLDEFRVSRSVRRELKHKRFSTRMDTSFHEVITHCAEVTNRGDQGSTWITPEVIDAYSNLFKRGVAHSFETYHDNTLVGGLYGIRVGKFFAAESSFYRMTNASKLAMLALVEYLQKEGISWFDCQVLTPFSESFGAREIPRSDFMKLLGEAHQAAL
jgi:leucyl/phenylalanyl-tRNA--protein transferase